jgi:hypothetical protein
MICGTHKVLRDEQYFEICEKLREAMNDFLLVDHKIVSIDNVKSFLGQ